MNFDNYEMIRNIISESIEVKNRLLKNAAMVDSISKAADLIVDCYDKGNKVLVFGNGGSAADSQHFAAELIVRFEKERQALPCIALTTDTSILTAAANDYDFSRVFSRQVEALAVKGDIVAAFSTSGNSLNVIEGIRAAKAVGAGSIGFTGCDGGDICKISDISIIADSDVTARIQEVHGLVIHCLCKIVEEKINDR